MTEQKKSKEQEELAKEIAKWGFKRQWPKSKWEESPIQYRKDYILLARTLVSEVLADRCWLKALDTERHIRISFSEWDKRNNWRPVLPIQKE